MTTTQQTTAPLIALSDSDGLQGAGFSIDNPNAPLRRGCGQSFS